MKSVVLTLVLLISSMALADDSYNCIKKCSQAHHQGYDNCRNERFRCDKSCFPISGYSPCMAACERNETACHRWNRENRIRCGQLCLGDEFVQEELNAENDIIDIDKNCSKACGIAWNNCLIGCQTSGDKYCRLQCEINSRRCSAACPQ